MSWKHIRDAAPRAKKPHRCHLCGLQIAVGEVHIYRFGIDGRDALTARFHSRCDELASSLDDGSGEIYGSNTLEFREMLRERDEKEGAL